MSGWVRQKCSIKSSKNWSEAARRRRERISQRSQRSTEWTSVARPDQLPPSGLWLIWLILAGRGWGKTRTGAETVNRWARESQIRIAVAGATAADVRDVMVEGASGLKTLYPDILYEPSKRRLTWPNGSTAILLSADEPDRFRGPQYHKAWVDELAVWRRPQAFDQLRFGLRLGDSPQCVCTTTPRPTKQIKKLVKRAREENGVALTKGSTYDNKANLSDGALQDFRDQYEGTRLGRQELYAELLEDTPGALWTLDRIEELRRNVVDVSTFMRIVVGIDPAVTSNEDSDDTGIVVTALGHDMHAYVLEDLTGKYTPGGWAKLAIAALHRHGADRIIAEVNNGGDLVEQTLRTSVPYGQNIPYQRIHASRGKRTRAEPVAALYEQGRVHHVGQLVALEDEMTSWDAGDPHAKSPNRVDALVWTITDLMFGAQQPRRRKTAGFVA